MENASKGLLIAAAVLIVIIIIAVSMRILNTTDGAEDGAKQVGESIKIETSKATDKLLGIFNGNKGNLSGKEVITNYTQAEIDADEHLYAIGATNPTYVVAKFNDDYTKVTITKNGEDSDGKIASFAPWSVSPMTSKSNTLKTVIIEKGITHTGESSAGNGTFSNCKKLTKIIIPDSVAVLRDFNGCTSLESITIPNGVTSLGSFSDCTNLKSITIPNSVTSLGSFSDCTNLKSITIPNSVTSIASFYGCTSLESITIPNSVTSIPAYAFYGCTNLKSITIPNSVTQIGNCAFYFCENLTNITIPNGVTSIPLNAFYFCESLTNITIPNSVTNIGRDAFIGCTSLKSITIPSSEINIDSGSFYNTGYYNNKTNWEDNVLYLGKHLIEARDNIKGDYIIKDGTIDIAINAFSQCNGLTSIVIPNTITNIPFGTFQFCSSLQTVTIPNTVTSIGDWVFHNCTNLSTIYCQTQTVADLVNNKVPSTVSVVVEPSRF